MSHQYSPEQGSTEQKPAEQKPAEQKSPEQLQAEIEAQRQQLASTVDDLAAKLDVKSQAQHKVASLKESATTTDGKPRPEVLAAAALVVIGVALVLWRRRR